VSFQLNRNQKKYVNFLVHIIGNHANDANILGTSVHTIKKNKEALVIASKEIGLEVNAGKTKYVHGYVSRSECRTKSRYKD
jgi:hypothetical protein